MNTSKDQLYQSRSNDKQSGSSECGDSDKKLTELIEFYDRVYRPIKLVLDQSNNEIYIQSYSSRLDADLLQDK